MEIGSGILKIWGVRRTGPIFGPHATCRPYTPCPKKVPSTLAYGLKLCQMLTDFHNSFTDRLSSKLLIKQ